MSMCSLSQADEIKLQDVISKLPNIKQGMAYSVPDGEFRPSTSTAILKKWGFSADVGYIGADTLAVFATYNVGNLSKWVEVPLSEFFNIQVGAYYGWERINQMKAGEDYGVQLSLIEVKF